MVRFTEPPPPLLGRNDHEILAENGLTNAEITIVGTSASFGAIPGRDREPEAHCDMRDVR